MHINWQDVLECSAEAYLEASMRCGDDISAIFDRDGRGRSSCMVIRLPGNLLETRGLMVAKEIRSFLSAVRCPMNYKEYVMHCQDRWT